MKIYQALKEKKKLVNAIMQISNLVKQNNSIPAENDFEFNIEELLKDRNQKVKELIDLKVRLNKSAQVVQPLIFELSELKETLKMYQDIDTQQGLVSHQYSDVQINKKVQLNKKDVLERMDALRGRIDEIQNKIDEFNYSTELL